MSVLALQGDGFTYPGFSLLGESSLSVDFFLTGTGGLGLEWLFLSGTTSVYGNLDDVSLGGAGAKATLGTGTGDLVVVGGSVLGTNEAAGNALGDSVKFGAAATAELFVNTGAEAGSTAGTAIKCSEPLMVTVVRSLFFSSS